MTDLERWQLFAKRVTFTFPFQVDVIISMDSKPPPHGDRVLVGVQLHVLDRDTRQPITVLTSRHALWTNEEEAVELMFDLLDIALKHEAHESVRIDGKLARPVHV